MTTPDTQQSWYQSRTVWLSLVIVASSGAGLFGLDINRDFQENVADIIMRFIEASAGLGAIYFRITATKTIK